MPSAIEENLGQEALSNSWKTGKPDLTTSGRQLPSAEKPNVTTTIWSFPRPSTRKAKRDYKCCVRCMPQMWRLRPSFTVLRICCNPKLWWQKNSEKYFSSGSTQGKRYCIVRTTTSFQAVELSASVLHQSIVAVDILLGFKTNLQKNDKSCSPQNGTSNVEVQLHKRTFMY